MIRFVLRFKWTISTALVLAALSAWTLWRHEWWRLADGAAAGIGGAVYVLVSDQVRRWRYRRRKAAASGGR